MKSMPYLENGPTTMTGCSDVGGNLVFQSNIWLAWKLLTTITHSLNMVGQK